MQRCIPSRTRRNFGSFSGFRRMETDIPLLVLHAHLSVCSLPTVSRGKIRPCIIGKSTGQCLLSRLDVFALEFRAEADRTLQYESSQNYSNESDYCQARNGIHSCHFRILFIRPGRANRKLSFFFRRLCWAFFRVTLSTSPHLERCSEINISKSLCRA